MKILFDKLSAHLEKQLLGVYLVSSEDPLQGGEAADAIRARARSAGFTERQTYFVDRGTNWNDIRGAAANRSLFAARRILEIRMRSGKPGVAGAQTLTRLMERRDADELLLILTESLDREAAGAAWVRAVQAHGAWVDIRAVPLAQLPEWLRARCRRAGLEADSQALELLAERTEGNLLAADQEIARLALMLPGGRLDARAITDSVANSARFSLYQLGDALLRGDAARVLHVLEGLRSEGEQVPLVLWYAMQALHGLARDPRADRLPLARLAARASRADRMLKGRLHGDPWDELELLGAEMCGRCVLPVPARRRA
ncbi:MAG: DNA polymerase III subunit delta [Steroidobacteraceae bacterium]